MKRKNVKLPGYNNKTNPISPFGNIPYTLIICASLWAIAILISINIHNNETISLVLLWIAAIASFSWFLYKTIENFTMTYSPDSWWTISSLKRTQRRKLYLLTNNLNAIGVLDLVDLFFAFSFMAGVLLLAVELTLPGTFGAFPVPSSDAAKLVYLTTSIGFSGLGVGFVVVEPLTLTGAILGYILTILFVLITITVLANASSLAQENARREVA
jgi:hypothetical protein